MKLPLSINPCPLREAIAEVRFDSNVPGDAVFGIVYQTLKDEFPNVEELALLSIPKQIRNKDGDFQFQPHYRLISADAKMAALIGPQVIAVGMKGNYPGWSVLSERIKSAMHRFHRAGILKTTLRLGLRYINFFEFDIYPQLLLKVTLDGAAWDDGEETFYKTVLPRGRCKCILQVGKGLAMASKPDKGGSVIDIDCFASGSGDFVADLETFLKSAHDSEKELFFSLLKPDFLKTLNPIYDNAG